MPSVESHMVFRQPQFSEDAAWLPSWLQQPNAESYEGQIREKQKTDSEQDHEEFPFLQDGLHADGDKNMSSRDARGSQKFHLFLSGDECSQLSFASSSRNVVNFHLHLSFDSNSESIGAPTLEQTERLEFNCAQRMPQIEYLLVPEQTINQFKVECDACLMKQSPVLQQELFNKDRQSTSNTKYEGEKYEDNVKIFKVPRIDDAVELAITASEALVIHEAIENGSEIDSLPASALLEVALRVKQARLEVLEETSHCSTKESSEIDFLTDLDESAMEDVYEDVGLSAAGDLHGCDLVVRDTFASEEYGSDDKVKCGELGDVEFGGADIYEKQLLEDVSDIAGQFKDFAFEKFDGDGKMKIYEDRWLDLNIAAEPYFNLQSISDVQAIIGTTKSVNLASSVQEVNSVKPASFEDAERDYKQANVVQERFQSRWLGGWTEMEEVKAFAPSKHDVTKKIPQLLVLETSFLSESADIAPDQNSFVQKDNEARDAISQPSIPFEGLGRDANEDVLCSVDIVRCSIQSVSDPLCSVVPCSISSEKSYSFLVQKNHNDDIDAEKCLSSVQEHNMNIFQTALDPDIKSVNKELLSVPSSNCEDPQHSVCRSVTSLRAYSMMLPSNYTLVEKRTSCFTPSIPLERNAKLIPSAIENGARDMTNEIRSCNVTTKDEVDFPSSAQKMRSNHIVTNKTDSQFQPVENVQVTIEGTDIEFPHFKNIQLTKTCRKKPHDTQASERKRVHFSDNQINYSQKKKLQNFHSAHQNRSRTSASKRLKGSHLYSGYEGEECKGLLTKCVNKVGKSPMLKNIEFLLTGFSTQKEREIKSLIRKYGGIVLSDIPSPPTAIKISTRSNCRSLPVILSCKKLQTLKFLYGCAVNACILAVNWLTDSIAAGSRLPPQEYTILPNYAGKKYTRVGKQLRYEYMFDRVGIVFHGKPKFCTKMAKIIKHGGGRVFRGLQWLVQSRDAKKISLGVIVAEDESRASRHLKHCALEQSIPLMPSSWIVKSLHVGKLLPFVETKFSSHLTPFQPLMSEEI